MVTVHVRDGRFDLVSVNVGRSSYPHVEKAKGTSLMAHDEMRGYKNTLCVL